MLQKFFLGRYGLDPFSIMLMIFSLMVIQTRYLWVLSIVITGYALFRILSKNKQKRLKELEGFNRIMGRYLFFVNSLLAKVVSFFRLQKRRYQERKTSILLKCPDCSKILRLPKNKGKIEVSCPVCSKQFIIKT